MNKTIIKNYAIRARNTLMEAMVQKAYEYDITEDGINDTEQTAIADDTFTNTEIRQRKQLIQRIREKGFRNTMEEAAYTWFNRFTALRYMEINGYLPSKVRVFTDENGTFKPEILKEALTVEIDGLDREKVMELLESQQTETLYEYLLITQCNALNQPLPEIFEKIGGWTELLFPSNLLKEGSIIQHLVEDIPESDWKDQIQIIGWLYQYYNTEPKEKIFADMKKNIKVGKESIPAATQLFTPDWIVRYMVENSLGRLWLEGNENSSVKSGWIYYLDNTEKTESHSEISNPEQIRFLDPCMGSGHILIYAFDVLLQIYLSVGWSERDAVSAIISKNLYGLDIDKRACQLAYFSLMMKARKHDRRFLTRGIQPNLSYFQDVPHLTNADVYGSLMNIVPEDIIRISDFHEAEKEHIMELYQIISQKYDVVCTNPPYMGGSHMNAVLSDFIRTNFPDYKSDLFSAFIIRCMQFAKPDSFLGFLTPYVWMFIQSYEKMRHMMYQQKTIETLIQFEYSAFEEATVPICTFVLRNRNISKNGCYLRLTEFRGGMEVQRQKTLEAIQNHDCGFCYEVNQEQFSAIPGAPVAYWVSRNVFESFQHDNIGTRMITREGMATADNDRFLRYWYEISYDKIGFHIRSEAESVTSQKKYFPYNKGGDFHKWYGNNHYVVNWENAGYEIRNHRDEKTGRIRSHNYNGDFAFQKGITWTSLSSGNISLRYAEEGFLFDSKGAKGFPKQECDFWYLLGLLNSNTAMLYLKFFSPTIDYKVGDVILIPYLEEETKKAEADRLVKENISLSESDWDSFETSWNFAKHPLL